MKAVSLYLLLWLNALILSVLSDQGTSHLTETDACFSSSSYPCSSSPRPQESSALLQRRSPSTSLGSARTHSLPHGGRVAVLLRGQSFRGNLTVQRKPCNTDARENQIRASRSLLDQIVIPLEKRSNKVDIILTDGPCARTVEILDIFGPSRILASQTMPSRNQDDNIRGAVDFFKKSVAGLSAVDPYGLVIITRHDLVVVKSIEHWPADFDLFNFWSHCEKNAGGSLNGFDCVNDVLQVMPGEAFSIFDAELGKTGCWCEVCEREMRDTWGHRIAAGHNFAAGHTCYPRIKQAMQASHSGVGFVTNWRPEKRIREKNDWAWLY